MSTWWDNIRYFKPGEFDSPDELGSGKLMVRDLVEILDITRGRLRRPIVITSGYRTGAYNSRPDVGGKPDSAHLRGLAADVTVPDSALRYSLLEQVFKNGVKRIGIGANFIHLDIDPSLPQKVLWLYDAQNT